MDGNTGLHRGWNVFASALQPGSSLRRTDDGWATAMIVRNEGGRAMRSEESVIDRKLGKALTAIDHATLALHLSRTAASQVQRVECAQRARVSFLAALAELEQAAPILKLRDAWLVWHTEAQNGLAAALSRLASLGV